jgi:hypothetical protein
MSRTIWHPAFCGAIRLELNEYRDDLVFEDEYQLTAESLRIDVVIIKKLRDIVIEKNIARIFRSHNILEYKSPDDYVSINDYNKVQGYNRLYASFNGIDIADLTVSFVTQRHPRKLLGYLSDRYRLVSNQDGIYVVEGDTCPTQIVISSELPEDENLWLTNLNKELTAARLTRILNAIKKHGKDVAVDAYIEVVADANMKKFQEVTMGKKLDNYLKELGLVDKWQAEGKTIFGRNMVLKVLQKKFIKIPPTIETTIQQMNDPVALESLVAGAYECQTLDEFADAIK